MRRSIIRILQSFAYGGLPQKKPEQADVIRQNRYRLARQSNLGMGALSNVQGAVAVRPLRMLQ